MQAVTSIDTTAAATIQRERRVGSRFVKELLGITDMTLWRWLNSETGFPQPIYISGRRYWRESEILAFLDAREAGQNDR